MQFVEAMVLSLFSFKEELSSCFHFIFPSSTFNKKNFYLSTDSIIFKKVIIISIFSIDLVTRYSKMSL